MTPKMFSSEVELGKFLGSIGVIPDAYQAILETSSTYQLHTSSSGFNVLAFDGVSDNYTNRFRNGEFDLISSEDHGVWNFISTKVNPKFYINKAAVELFDEQYSRSDELLKLSNQLINDPLIITGRGLGGYLAILFTILHQHAVDVEESNGSKTTKRPICITFGSPLLGDQGLQSAISQRPQWKSCFLNMVSLGDPLASFFTSNNPYKPFGTFFFCTESGGHTAFQDQAPIMAVLDAMASLMAEDNFQMHDYRNDLGLIRKKVMYRGASELGEFNLNSLKAGITTQFMELCLLNNIPNGLITAMEKEQGDVIKKKRRNNAYEPTKKLNEMKISLTYMEWYMKGQKSKGGYYDGYKNAKTQKEIESLHEVIKHQRILNQYWEKFVREKEQMPQKEGAKLRTRWLYGGTNYRRIVEPLDIADYYKKGNTNYIENRPNHYKLLEQLSEDDKKGKKPSDKKTKAASLTEDSCFWANVEEALIVLEQLKNGGESSIPTAIKQFEVYVMGEIKNFSVSPDVFLEGSSLMKWWSEYYKAYKESLCDSEFARYMNNKETGYGLYQ